MTRRPAIPDRALPWLSVLGVLALFELLPRVGVLPSDHFPPISETLGTLFDQLGESRFWEAVGNTLEGWALGLVFLHPLMALWILDRELRRRRPAWLLAYRLCLLGVPLLLGLVHDGVLAQGERQAQELWGLREAISESLSRVGLPHKNDVSLPIARLEPFCAELLVLLGARHPGWEVYLFGHIGDGNLHINVLKPADLEASAFLARAHEVDRDLFALVRQHQGPGEV